MGRSHVGGPAPATRGRTLHWARHYDAVVWLLTLGGARSVRERTVQLAQIKPGDKVLDVGCGTGDLTIAAKKIAGPTGEVYGIDASPEMIAVASRKAARAGVDVTFKIDLIEDLSFPDDTFDVVLSSLMIHHLPDDLKIKGLSEVRRVLKRGGHVLIVDIRRPDSWLGHLSMVFLHHRALNYGIQDLPPMLEELGFTKLESGGPILRVLGDIRGQAG